jgi:uncharacterized protein with FMN-binding domain
VVITNGPITEGQFLAYPGGDTRSAEINAQATGMLVQEAIQAQSTDVQVLSGATFTSQAFCSLSTRLCNRLSRVRGPVRY